MGNMGVKNQFLQLVIAGHGISTLASPRGFLLEDIGCVLEHICKAGVNACMDGSGTMSEPVSLAVFTKWLWVRALIRSGGA